MAFPTNILSIEQLNHLTRKLAPARVGNHEVDAIDGEEQLWSCLIDTVHCPAVSDKHMTAACNAICFTLRANALGSNEALRKFAHSTQTWTQTFGAARCAFAAGKNKPALQVLDTLAYLTGEIPEKHDAVQVVESVMREMTEIIFTQKPKKRLKEACIVLYFFLRKFSDFMSATVVLEAALRKSRSIFLRLCASSNIDPGRTVQDKSDPWFPFVLSLLMVTKVAESKSATLKLLSLLCTDKFIVRDVDLVSTTNRAIDVYSAANDYGLEDVIQEVLPAVLTNSTQYHTFLTKQLDSSGGRISTLEVILGILSFGKLRNYVTEDELPGQISGILTRFGALSLGNDTFLGFEVLLSHAFPSIRLRALNLLVASKSPNTPIRPEMFRCLIKVLPSLHDDTDAFHRGELFSVFRRFLTRVQQSYHVLSKDQTKDSLVDLLREYTTFCSQYCAFLKSETSNHVSYARHILSLDLLNFMTEQIWPCEAFTAVSLSDEAFLARLFRLVLDAYDDIRAVSANTLLNIAKVKRDDFDSALKHIKPLSLASQLAVATNRADHADALGRLIALLQRTIVTSGQRVCKDQQTMRDLKNHVAALSTWIQGVDSFDVTTTYPLHGSLLGIRYLLESSALSYPTMAGCELKDCLLVVCQKIWSLAQPHLCVDSPEVEADVNDELESSGPKDLLAYAWRALRDANLMMQALLNTSISDYTALSSVGGMCFEQLALLRHRGAFSTVAQTFVLCCQKCRSSNELEIQFLTRKWFSTALEELQSQADKLTRRSAGLPAMFTALLDPQDDRKFSVYIQELVQIAIQPAPDQRGAEAEEKLRLPQVHALNCLKDIMTASRFRTRTEPLVVPMVDLAAQCMNSHVWAIKNCGLMLLRASIKRLDPDTDLGGSEAGISIQALSDVERRPIDVALSLLFSPSYVPSVTGESETTSEQNGAQSDGGNETVFAGLDLVGRLDIRKHENLSVRSAIARQLGNNLWHIRAQAARLLTAMTPLDEEIAVVQEILCPLPDFIGLNECHGRLLVARGFLTRLQEGSAPTEYQETFAKSLVEASCSALLASNKTLRALWFETATQLIHSTPTSSTIPARLYQAFSEQLSGQSNNDDQPMALYDRALADFVLQVHIFTGVIDHDQVISYVGKDDDISGYVFEQSQTLKTLEHSERYFNIIKTVLQSTKMGGTRPSALKAAVTCLNGHLFLPNAVDLTALIDVLRFEQPTSRDTVIAQLSLYAALCKIVWQSHGTIVQRLRDLSTGFCRHLRFAADDETEEPTRRAAVEALQQWQDLASVDDMVNAGFGSKGKLEILSVLYDLLNDDDDEIRERAAEVVAVFSQSEMNGSGQGIGLCALASRQRLRDHHFLEFTNTELLGTECVRRLLHIRLWHSHDRLEQGILRHCQRNTVVKQILEVIAAANDLFAEEKQNLYIDEVAELKAWARVFTSTQCQLPDSLISNIGIWVHNGLDSIREVLEGENNCLDHTSDKVVKRGHGDQASQHTAVLELGIGSTPELEILLARVITVASVLVRSGSPRGQEQDELARTILASLRKVHEMCRNMNVPALVLESFTWSSE